MNKPVVAVIVALAGLSHSLASRAGIVTLTGSQFDVVYNTSDLGLFGTPQLIGDYLVFTPNQFDAQSLNGAGTNTTSSSVSAIQLVANPGFQFGDLSVADIGDYLMQGTGTLVGVTGTLTATDAARPLTQTIANLVVPGPLNIADGTVHNWSGSAMINNATPTVTPGYNPWLAQAASIDVQLADTLTATTTNTPSQAFIQEKFSSIELIVDPVPVPLPGTLWLCVLGLASLIGMSRSRQVI